MRVSNKYVFFWGDWPSNWFKCKFDAEHEGKTYTFYNSEQYFMFIKAVTFGDKEIAKEIIAKGKNPKIAKALGRKVKNYDNKVWDGMRFQVMVDANMLKYSQNNFLKERLLSKEYDGKHFCEASSYDKIWGVGMTEDNPLILDEKNWKGQNLLGKTLDKVRENLK